jgi:hypothetical protein
MASSHEIRMTQKSILFDLLEAKEEKKGIDTLIAKMKASMDAEDFAYAEKVFKELKGNKNK